MDSVGRAVASFHPKTQPYMLRANYARELAVEFYWALLAHAQPKNAAAALTMARQALLDGGKHDHARFAVCDHATPVLYGEQQPGLAPACGHGEERGLAVFVLDV